MAALLYALAAVVLTSTPTAAARPCPPGGITAAQFRPHSSAVWRLDRWRRGAPKPVAIHAYRRALRCAAGPGHRRAIEHRWGNDRIRYGQHRVVQLRRHSIDRVWGPPIWAPDWSTPPGSQLPPWLIAALAERTGDLLGVDVPGWTMAQMTQGESIRRPASAAVDPGGSVGYGLHAITRPFADDLLAVRGWRYESDMWNPIRNTVIMTLIYARQGLGAWYGDHHVTCWDCHYRGRVDLRLWLNGRTLRQAIRR